MRANFAEISMVRLHLNHLNVTLPAASAHFFSADTSTELPPIAIDDCAVVPIPAAVNALPRTAGTEVDLDGADHLALLPSMTDNSRYVATTSFADYASNGTWSLSWPGSIATNGEQAASLTSALTMPEFLFVSQPPHNQAMNLSLDTSLTIIWTGNPTPLSGEDLLIRVSAGTCVAGEFPVVEVACRVADDGNFVVPAAILDSLDPGACANINVERIRSTVEILPDGTTVHIQAGVSEYWRGYKS
jgi:hypothetical protein